MTTATEAKATAAQEKGQDTSTAPETEAAAPAAPAAPAASDEAETPATTEGSKDAKAAAQEPVDEVDEKLASLRRMVLARSAVNSGGLVGGVGLKATDLAGLRDALAADPEMVRGFLRQEVDSCLATAGISYGLDEEQINQAVADFVAGVEAGSKKPVTRKVASGEPATAGEDGRVEYPLNHRGRAFAELAGLDRKSTRTQANVVNAGDVLARLVPPQAPSPGTDVTGAEIPPSKQPKSASIEALAGDNTELSGDTITAACDGLCIEDAGGTVRVIPEILLDSVDGTTGRVPESGISASNVGVRGSVSGDAGVATSENLFVGEGTGGGSIEGTAAVQARNIVVNGQISGTEDAKALVEAHEICVARAITNRSVNAVTLLIDGDSHLGRLEAESDLRVDGNVRGGILRCPGRIAVGGDIGTEAGGSHTRIVFNGGSAAARRERQKAVTMQKLRAEFDALQAELDKLTEESDKRAKADKYWAQMVDGEAGPPQGAMQKKVVQIFESWSERHRKVERKIAAVARPLKQLQQQDEAEASDEETSAELTVIGKVWLDVEFEYACQMGSEDGDTQVTFSHDGQRFRNHKLSDVRRALNEQVAKYLEREGASVEEKKAAIDKMFEGRDKKPTAPKVEHKTFEIDLTWSGAEESETLETSARARVSSEDPQTVHIVNVVRPRQPLSNVTVTVTAEGSRAAFSVEAMGQAPKAWKRDEEITEMLQGIAVAGTSAAAWLEGEPLGVASGGPAAEETE